MRGISLHHGSHEEALDQAGIAKRWGQTKPPLALHDHMTGHKFFGHDDPIDEDLRDVPPVLDEINHSWADIRSLNFKSGKNFAHHIRVLLHHRKEQGPNIDVLVWGIENSLWLGQQFCAD